MKLGNFQNGGPETITIGYYGEKGNTFGIAVDSHFASAKGHSMCELGTEIDIYPSNGDPRTIKAPECNDEEKNKRWWFVGCFNGNTKLDGFQVHNKMMDRRPDIAVLCKSG